MVDGNGNDEGKDSTASLDLSQHEKDFVARTHATHIKCSIADCKIHLLVHLIIRIEAGRRKSEHDLEAIQEGEMGTHGKNGLCAQCAWSNIDWIRSLASDWGGKQA